MKIICRRRNYVNKKLIHILHHLVCIQSEGNADIQECLMKEN